jgi:hypothetical protein
MQEGKVHSKNHPSADELASDEKFWEREQSRGGKKRGKRYLY